MNIAIIQIWSSKRNGKLVVRMLIMKRDTEKPIELKWTKSKNVTSLLEPKVDLPAKLPSCQKPPGGVHPTWKVAVATRTDITSSTLQASLGESWPFLNLKYSTKFFGRTREVTEAEGLPTWMWLPNSNEEAGEDVMMISISCFNGSCTSKDLLYFSVTGPASKNQ